MTKQQLRQMLREHDTNVKPFTIWIKPKEDVIDTANQTKLQDDVRRVPQVASCVETGTLR